MIETIDDLIDYVKKELNASEQREGDCFSSELRMYDGSFSESYYYGGMSDVYAKILEKANELKANMNTLEEIE